jgi:hypothetical protein
MSASTPPSPDAELSTAEHRSSNGAAPDIRRDVVDRIVVLGYITAVAIPPVGLILGIVLLVRPATPNSKHGAWIIALTIIAATVWVLLLASGAVNTTSTDGS